jgi:hypothetical protein
MHELMGHILLFIKRIWGAEEWGKFKRNNQPLKLYPFQRRRSLANIKLSLQKEKGKINWGGGGEVFAHSRRKVQRKIII